jgi:tripeptidyl-peptidase-1
MAIWWRELLCLALLSISFLNALKIEELLVNKFYSQLDQIESRRAPKKFHRKEAPNAKNLQLYTRIHTADKNALHEGVFYLKQQNAGSLEQILNDVSNPFSPKYGKYLSMEEIKSLTIDKGSTHHIVQILQNHGFQKITPTLTEDFIIVEGQISLWESLLNCEFHLFQHNEKADLKVIRTLEYSLPDELIAHVETVFNTVHFPISPSPVLERTLIDKKIDLSRNLHGYLTPSLLFSFYHIDPIGNNLASQGVYETIGQTFSPSDLTLFQRTFNLTVEPVSRVIGGHSSDQTCIDKPDDCGEANLDVQYLMVISFSCYFSSF